MRIITIAPYEMCCRSRWGWHTFRDGKNYNGKIIGFRFLGIGLTWRAPNAGGQRWLPATRSRRHKNDMSNQQSPEPETRGSHSSPPLGSAINLDLYEPTIRCRTKSIISGEHEEMMEHTDPVFRDIGVLREWLADNELQEITVCSTNIGFVKTFRKFYRGSMSPNAGGQR